jgi:glyoxylase-like metal-dependent hydrolase (beta-lactamase superfamily II)
MKVDPEPWSAAAPSMDELTRHPGGVFAIDARYMRPRLDAIHLVVENGRAAFVDSGTLHSVPHALAALDALGLGREAVDWVFLTHVHLDHAGGAGGLMRALPNARAVLHPRGAPHLIDPTALESASIRVYGETQYRALYGEIVPIPADRVVVTRDGERIALAGRPFDILHTPGHALHHQVIVDVGHRAVFCGDTFGISYRDFDVDGRATIIPTTTPTQFDPEQLCASIDRVLALRPSALYLTHYSRVTEVERLGAELKEQVRAFADLARTHAAAPDRRERIRGDMRRLWIERLTAHGRVAAAAEVDALLANDLDLNSDGLVAWLNRRKH